MQLMENAIRPYAWGSRTAIAEIIGLPSPTAHPQAELWMGAHPSDSSQLVTGPEPVLLSDAVAADPLATLGSAVMEAFEGRFPFLLKLLAAAEPLSLQAHPSADQASAGFARDEAAGIARTDPARNYVDAWPKPELLCALTEFHALCGFAPPARTVELLRGLQVPQLDHYLELLAGQMDDEGTRALFSSFITIPPQVLRGLLEAVLAACVTQVREGSSPFVAEYRTALDLGERYPGDPGVLASLMLNRLTLQPGESIYFDSGILHAYLSGTGIEIMGNSDNVLRGGLTPKHVDVPELMRVLNFSSGPVTISSGQLSPDGEIVYQAPAAEFRLSRFPLSDTPREITHRGPQIIFVVEGSATLHNASGLQLEVKQGQSAWIAAADEHVTIVGTGRAFRAVDGLPSA